MIENNYNETYYRLISTQRNYQRLISDTINNKTTIRYIGNYLTDSQDINLELSTPFIDTNSKNKSMVISQITLLSTNPDFVSYLPLKISIGNTIIPFIADYDNPLKTIPLITENQGFQDKFINNKWVKFTEYSTVIEPNVIYNQVVITKTSDVIDLVNDRIFISNNTNLYVSTIENLINKVPLTLLMNGINIQSRIKTNGYNVVFAAGNRLYDASFTPVRDITAGALEYTCYDAFNIDGNRGIIAIKTKNIVLAPPAVVSYYLLPELQLISDNLINNITFFPFAVINLERELISRCTSMVMVNYTLAIGISWGADEDTAGSIILFFLDRKTKLYRVRIHKCDIFNNYDYQNIELISFFQHDMVVSLNENTILPLDYGDTKYNFTLAFNYTTPSQLSLFGNILINSEDINYKTIEEYELELEPTEILSNRRYRNLLIAKYSDRNPNYKVFNSSDSTTNEIVKINKLYSFDIIDFYVNQHYFVEIGEYKFLNNLTDVLVINLSINERDDVNKLSSYTRDYFNLEVPYQFLSSISFKILDDELYNKLEIIKVIVDIALKNSNEKQSNPVEQISRKKDKLRKKLRKSDLDIKNVLNAGDDDLPLIKDVLHLI